MLSTRLKLHEGAQVCIVDDDDSVRASLARLLRSAGLKPKTYESAEDFLRRADAGRGEPSCVILDVRMAGMSGLELQEELLARGSMPPVIFLTGHGDIPMSVRAMKHGASDFLTKPVEDLDLLGAVARALDLHRSLLDSADSALAERLGRLTPREFEVMRCVVSGAPNKQIASCLGIAEKTVKVHRGRVMQKLEAGSVAELVRLSIDAKVDPIQDQA